MHTKFHEDWFRYSNVDGGGYIDTHREHSDLLRLLLFFKIGKVG
jgi:hypothetical protein